MAPLMTDATAYEDQPYLTELSTEVVSAGELDDRPYALLRATICYPEGGGQPPDRARLNGVAVTDVQRRDEDILHFLEAPVEAGPAKLELDWERRFDHMQQHTAQHLLSAIAAERFGWATTSFHLGVGQSDIELDTESIGEAELTELERQVLTEIRAARPVTARRVTLDEYRELDIRTRGLPEDHTGDVRLVEIEGIDVTTCGGTHLSSTAEIETMRLGPTESLRGGTRLYWMAGGRVRRRLALLESRNSDLRRLLETGGDELVEIATQKALALKEARKSLDRRLGELASAHAHALAAAPATLVDAHFDDVDGGFLQRIARELLELASGKVALLTASSEKGDFFLLAAGPDSGLDVAEAGPQVAGILDGRGGGSGTSFQGKAGSLSGRDHALTRLSELA